ncbi:hypothetical protein BGZ63DRAFT_461498, partial [Mariannaea sp. PMI_226]
MMRRRQYRCCDPCRKAKRACDAQPVFNSQDEPLFKDDPCSYCVKTKKSCSFEWVKALMDISSKEEKEMKQEEDDSKAKRWPEPKKKKKQPIARKKRKPTRANDEYINTLHDHIKTLEARLVTLQSQNQTLETQIHMLQQIDTQMQTSQHPINCLLSTTPTSNSIVTKPATGVNAEAIIAPEEPSKQLLDPS